MIDWSAEQRDLRATLTPWFEKLGDGHSDYDRAAEFPSGPWRTVRESGLLGLPFGTRWGGLDQSLLTTMYVLEALGHGCPNGGLNFSVTTHMVSTGVPVQRFGSDALKEAYLPGIVDGRTIGSHAITEPDGGSDALAMRTTAVRDGDDYVLNGAKTFVSNGPVADLVVVYARTDTTAGPLGISAFLVERGTPGLSFGNPIATMGLRASPIGELFLDDCRVPARNLIGAPGSGFMILDHVMKWEILCSFIVTTGEMQRRLDRCVDYAKTRHAFGRPIGSNQSVANRVVEMRIGTETARKWLYDTAWKLTRGQNVALDLAAAKLMTSEASLTSALHAVQIFGGNGYTEEYGLEAELRNAVAGTIYSGTTDIQKARIAALLGL